jgi:hypothetical protein
MTKPSLALALAVLAAVLAMPRPVLACPSCAEAPAAMSGGEDEQQSINNPRAYNQSIYIMVGVPYFTLAAFAFLTYRGMKKNEAFHRARAALGESGASAVPLIAD